MIALLSIGILSGLFFSSSFVLNRLMSVEGGHWIWSASLRYAFMILFLFVIIALFQGVKAPWRVLGLFIKNWLFWMLAGTIGFGGFYSLLCFSADHAPGWVIASTWQLTIIASLVVLMGFGRKFPKKIWVFSLIVFVGVLLVNLSNTEISNTSQLLKSAFPVLIAAFCYPIGNQMVWEAKNNNGSLPNIHHPLLENPFNKVLLMSLGSVPFWIILIAVGQPGIPSEGQLINTALVALFSGIIATSLFLLARNRAKRPSELAAVDATQSSEVVFAMIGETLILSAPLPNGVAMMGVVCIFVGLTLFIRFQDVKKT